MSGKAKKFKSNWFRVAVEGATTDGRKIQRSWIEDMGANYNPETYGSRVWMEHLRSLLPDSPFRAYGDVLATKAEEVTVDGEKKLALFAQIKPTPDLVNIVNNLKQKIYTSIEIAENFADSGKAYLVGLGVTDSPASLGTSMLAFAAQNPDANPLADRKQAPGNVFTAAMETAIEFTEHEPAPEVPSLVDRIKSIFARKPDGATEVLKQFGELGDAVTEIAEQVRGQNDQFGQLKTTNEATAADLKKLREEFSELTQRLSTEADPKQHPRPPVSGARAEVLTDC